MKNTSLIQKCEICKKELGFHDRTIRHEKMWYHVECYRSTIKKKIIIEEKTLEKELVKATIVKPVVKATIVKPVVKATIVEPIPKCGLCEKELEFHDRTVRHEKKWYHAKCYKSTIEVNPLEKE